MVRIERVPVEREKWVRESEKEIGYGEYIYRERSRAMKLSKN